MSNPAGWHPDPLDRHELRYWDGAAWTDHVSNRGDAGIDRLDGSAPTSRDKRWAEQVEDAPLDATTIIAPVAAPVAAAASKPSPWRQFRGLSTWMQALTAGMVLVTLVAIAGAGDDGRDGVAQLSTADAPTSTTVEHITEVTSTPTTNAPAPPATTTTTAPPTTTTTARPPTTTTTAVRPPSTTATPTTAGLPAPTTTAASSTSNRCHPSYEGTCIPPDVSDADCAGGTGDGPWYVQEKNIRVVGPDVFRLDSGGAPGIGCESD